MPTPEETREFATWLVGHALVAWSIRARPLISMRANPAFPLWAAAATAAGILLSTLAAKQIDLLPLPASAWLFVVGSASASALLALAGRHVLRTGTL